MKIKDIQLRKFMSHDKTDIKLPESGIVCVTGNNGAGKSSLMESVAYCLWGKSLRGTPTWRGGVTSKVAITLGDGTKVQRARKGAKTNLAFTRRGEKAFKADTPSKTQALLEQHIGTPFEVWRRSCVFSSSDAANFSLATDAERKRLLEKLIGLSHLDDALKSCRTDLAEARLHLKDTESKLEGKRGTLSEREERLNDAKLALSTTMPDGDLASLRVKVRELTTHIAGCHADASELEESIKAHIRGGAEHSFGLKDMEARLKKLSFQECPTCGQFIPQNLRDSAEKEVVDTQERIEDAQAANKKEVELLEGQQSELYEEIKVLQESHQQLAKQGGAIRALTEKQEKASKLVTEIDESLESLAAEILALEGEESSKIMSVQELEAVERVLGLKGVRSHILSKILAGLEVTANKWLSKIAGGKVTLSMKAYKTNKKGNTSDAISMEIAGLADGHGYKGSSGGERRRLDVAILLALAEVSRAARGSEAGTVWFDEVFDSLDKEGCARVKESLFELASDRAVVIVTHNYDLVETLQGCLHLRVDEGVVT